MENPIWTEIKKQFPGAHNRALRDRIFKLAQTGRVIGLERTVALTGHGKAALRNVQKFIEAKAG